MSSRVRVVDQCTLRGLERLALISGIAGSLACFAPIAHADAGAFSWSRARGADHCPSRAQIVARLEESLGHPLEVSLEDRSIDAVVERVGDEWTVTLYWRASDGTPAGTRTIRSTETDCNVATQSAVASILVALGADGIDAAATPHAASSSGPPNPSPTASGAPATASSAPPASSSAPPPVTRRNEPAPESADRVRTGDIVLSGILTVGWLPSPAYGVQLIAEPLHWRRLRVSILASTLAEVRLALGSVQAGFTALEFGSDVCGTVVQVASWVELIACGGLRGGVVQSTVYSGAQGLGGAQASFAAEATGMIRLTPVAPAVLEVGFIGRLNLTQYTLAGPAGEGLYTQSLGAFITTIRLGVHF